MMFKQSSNTLSESSRMPALKQRRPMKSMPMSIKLALTAGQVPRMRDCRRRCHPRSTASHRHSSRCCAGIHLPIKKKTSHGTANGCFPEPFMARTTVQRIGANSTHAQDRNKREEVLIGNLVIAARARTNKQKRTLHGGTIACMEGFQTRAERSQVPLDHLSTGHAINGKKRIQCKSKQTRCHDVCHQLNMPIAQERYIYLHVLPCCEYMHCLLADSSPCHASGDCAHVGQSHRVGKRRRRCGSLSPKESREHSP